MLRTAKTTGILTALLLSLLYLFVFFLSYFENSCYLSYYFFFCRRLFLVLFMYVLAFVACISAPASCYIHASCLLLSYCSVSLPSETSVGVMLFDLLWAVSPISSYRQYYWNFSTGYEDDPFRALSSYLVEFIFSCMPVVIGFLRVPSLLMRLSAS